MSIRAVLTIKLSDIHMPNLLQRLSLSLLSADSKKAFKVVWQKITWGGLHCIEHLTKGQLLHVKEPC